MTLFTGGDPINGSATADIILNQSAGSTIFGDDGDDYILGAISAFYMLSTAHTTFGTAFDLDSQLAMWTLDENAAIANSTTIPHASAYITPGGTSGQYFSVYLEAGQQITVDVDATHGSVGSDASEDTIVRIFNPSESEVFFNDDSFQDTEQGGIFDPGGSYTASTSGTHYIYIQDLLDYYAPTTLLAANTEIVVHFSVTDHAVGAATVQGDEEIHGGTGNDFIAGNGGDDDLYGDDGNDTIYGGSGNDTIRGGNDNDRIFGGSGNDLILGGLGSDTIDAGGGTNNVDGGAGDDNIVAGSGSDTLTGGSGNDTVDGGFGDDVVDGGNNDDEVFGGGGNDTVLGGQGNDILSGGLGDDIMDGGEGDDTANYYGASSGVIVDLTAGTATGEGNDVLSFIESVFGTDFDDSLSGNSEDNELTGFLGNDFLIGYAGDDYLNGGGGNDTLNGRGGSDEILGGSGNDLIFAGSGDDTVDGQAGADSIFGGFGADDLSGGFGDDTLGGGGGDDVINGGGGNDTMSGGTGDDRFVFELNSGDDTINLFKAGAGSDDVLDFSALGSGVQFGDLNISSIGGGTLITTPNGDNVFLAGVAPGDLDSSADFIFAPIV